MKNEKIFNNVIWYITVAIRVVVFSLLLFKTCVIYNDQVFKVILFTILGLGLSFFTTTLLHELGHLLFGLLFGLIPESFRVLWFNFKIINKKFKIFLTKMNGKLGETDFYANDVKNVSFRIGMAAIGGLFVNFLLVVASLLIAIFTIDKSLIAFCLFGITFVVPFYILSASSVPFKHDCDGWVAIAMLFGDVTPKAASNYFVALKQIYDGVSPEEINPNLLSIYTQDYDPYSIEIIHLRYLSYIGFNKDKAFKEIVKVSDRDKLSSSSFDEIYSEMLFCSLLLHDEKFVKDNENAVLNYLESIDTPTSFRIQAAVCIHHGEIGRAKLLIKSGLQLCDSFEIKGIAKLEKKLLNEMAKVIE